MTIDRPILRGLEILELGRRLVEMPQTPTLLLIASDVALTETLTTYLLDEGYQIIDAAEGMKAVRLVRTLHPDLIMLDADLAGGGAVTLCGLVRKESNAPLVLLVSGEDEFERIIGLDMGADLCMVKPVSLAELRARLRALLRRSSSAAATRSQSFTAGRLHLDIDRRRVWTGDRELHLTSREFDLLACLMRHRGLVLSREQLLKDVWGERVSSRSRTLEVHIRWLRQKVEPDPARPIYIQTVRQIGYRFDVP
jgi:DNA-binding response OmpR family regulator